VDLDKLGESQRLICIPAPGQELLVGRSSQSPSFWSSLVPSEPVRNLISRTHFKVAMKTGYPADSSEAGCWVTCVSPNGLLLDDEVLLPGGGERRIRPGSSLALLAMAEKGRSGELLSRKPFLVFVLGSPGAPFVFSQPAAEALPPGASAGWWLPEGSADRAPVTDAIMSLEVHGEGVRPDLAREERQVLLRAGPDAARTGARLLVGRRHQGPFWRRVLLPGFYAEGCWPFLASDAFEVLAQKPRDPVTSELKDWRFRVRVLCSAGLTVNESVVCPSGEEHALGPGDTLTVDVPSAASAPSGGASSGRASRRGLHFTFGLCLPVARPPPLVTALAPAAPLRLPDIAGPAAGLPADGMSPVGMAPFQGARPPQQWTGAHAAGALQTPVTIAFGPDSAH